jgi:hypothetical protein
VTTPSENRSTQVRPPTLSEAALRHLREDLIKGRFQPATRCASTRSQRRSA